MERTLNTKFYTFNQNNSGGSFVTSDNEGLSEYVIIEATDANHANERAERIGLYFNGCDDGRDCYCCGDRWYTVSENDGTDEPTIYGEPIAIVKKGMFRKELFVHYIDGTFKKVELQD
jgi:hypothetical protein